jgi:hypothetical protein
MTYAQAFIRVLILVVLSTSINAHLEPRTTPLTTSEIQAKGKTRAMLKACKRLKKQQRIKHDRLCGR